MLANFLLTKGLINCSVVWPTERFLFCAGYIYIFSFCIIQVVLALGFFLCVPCCFGPSSVLKCFFLLSEPLMLFAENL